LQNIDESRLSDDDEVVFTNRFTSASLAPGKKPLPTDQSKPKTQVNNPAITAQKLHQLPT
jgi:hypothetical protein